MKSVFDAYKAALDALRPLPPSVAKERAIERLEESAFWASSAIAGQPSPIDYVSDDPRVKKRPGS